MKKLIILAILLCFPAILSGAELTDKPISIEPIAEPSISERIAVKEALIDKTQSETVQVDARTAIVNEEVAVVTQEWAELIKPLEVSVLESGTVPVGYQAKEANKTFLSVQQSEKLKEVLRMIPATQYSVVKFSFIEADSNDPNIYWIDARKWLDVNVMQAEIKDKYIKLAVIGVTLKGGSAYNNWHPKNETLTTGQLSFRAREYEVLYQAFKQARPDVPVVFVAVMFPNLAEWLNSFTIKPDGWMLFNLDYYSVNWTKVKSRWFADKPVIANINYGYTFGEGKEQIYDANFGNTLKALGYAGQVYWRKQ